MHRGMGKLKTRLRKITNSPRSGKCNRYENDMHMCFYYIRFTLYSLETSIEDKSRPGF